MSTKKETTYAALHGTIKAHTEKAILFKLSEESHGETGEYWFPLSQCREITRTEDVDGDLVLVADWLVQKHEIDV
jgi:hypothetical protein